MEPKVCPTCHFIINDTFYFCPNCGRKLKTPPADTSIWKQTKLYALSIFLPPLGLFPGVKYVFDKNPKAKIIGAIAIVLTIISFVVNIWLIKGLMDRVNSEINKQLNLYQNGGLP